MARQITTASLLIHLGVRVAGVSQRPGPHRPSYDFDEKIAQTLLRHIVDLVVWQQQQLEAQLLDECGRGCAVQPVQTDGGCHFRDTQNRRAGRLQFRIELTQAEIISSCYYTSFAD
jgi:hypothetical protein